MELKINRKLNERKLFLIRGLDRKNVSQVQYDKEMPELERKIFANLQAFLAESQKELAAKLLETKKVVHEDGQFKRSIAKMLIDFLDGNIPNKEIKGVFRQGYKMMRAKE